MKRFLLFIALALLLAQPLAAKTLSTVAAVVNNEIISTYQLDKAVLDALAKEPKGNQLTSSQFEQLKSTVLDTMINEKLVAQRIKELDLRVPDPELNAAIEDVQQKNKLSAEQLKQAVEAQGMSFEEYRQEIKKEILHFKLLSREVNAKVQVTAGEVREYFREHIDQYRAKPQMRVSSMSFEIPAGSSDEELEQLRKQVADVREQLQQGGDFDQLLEAQGDSAFGGDMGSLVIEDLTPQLQQALQGLEVGQVSEPLEMNNQLHLFLVTDYNPGDKNLFDKVKGEIERTLMQQKTEARFKEWTQELRERGHIEIRL